MSLLWEAPPILCPLLSSVELISQALTCIKTVHPSGTQVGTLPNNLDNVTITIKDNYQKFFTHTTSPLAK
jgi:hypothetical protein